MPGTPRRANVPASQRSERHPPPVLDQPDVVDHVDAPPAERPPDEPAPAPEHPRCWACSWTLYASLGGELYCVHPSCPQLHDVIGTLVADRAVLDRLREAIAQANGEQRSDRPRPSPGPRTEPIKAQPPIY